MAGWVTRKRIAAESEALRRANAEEIGRREEAARLRKLVLTYCDEADRDYADSPDVLVVTFDLRNLINRVD